MIRLDKSIEPTERVAAKIKIEEPEIIYHYCSVETFISIIENKTLRLSDITKSNDSMELIWISEYIKKEFDRYYDNNKEFLSTICNKSEWNNVVKYYIFEWFSEDHRKYSGYVMCFSDKGDLLSQWRGYADDGKGVSIGFDFSTLKKIIDSEYGLCIGKAEYNKKEQENKIDKIANIVIENLKCNSNIDNCFKQIVYDLFETALTCKNSFFSEENEYRIMYIVDRETVINKGKRKIISDSHYSYEKENNVVIPINIYSYLEPLHFSASGSRISSYQDLCFAPGIALGTSTEIEFNPIASVILGPKCEADICEVEKILQANSLMNVNVKKSKGTYR